MIVDIEPGMMKFRTPGKDSVIVAVSDGLMKVENNDVLILVDTIERPEEIDENRARRAADEAREAILQKKSIQDYKMAQYRMSRALNRLKVKHYSGQ